MIINTYCRRCTYEDSFTPYTHVFVHHVPFFMKKYGYLYPFQMEEVEHLNYVNKLVFHHSSDHGKGKHRITEQVIIIAYI